MSFIARPVNGCNEVGETLYLVSFVANGASAPNPDLFRGPGLVSVVRNSAGTFTVTLDRTFFRIDYTDAQVEPAGGGDGVYATATSAEGTDPYVFQVFTHAAGGAKTDYTGRRVRIKLIAKLSSV